MQCSPHQSRSHPVKRFVALLTVALLALGLITAPHAAAYGGVIWYTDYGAGAGQKTAYSTNHWREPYACTIAWQSDCLIWQTDGNLVIYRNYAARWASNTHTPGSCTCTMIMQHDGNIVLYTSWGQPYWATNTNYGTMWDYQLQLRYT